MAKLGPADPFRLLLSLAYLIKTALSQYSMQQYR
jgi:hypothetical protein